jgi:uncharacterized membrane protein
VATIENSITIARPISDVYRTVTNYDDDEQMKQWRTSIVNIGITAGNPLRTGSMIAMTKQFRGSGIFVNADVTDLQRNKRVELKGMHGRFPFVRSIEFAPSGRETVIRDHIELRTPWFFFFYTPILTGALNRQVKREWEALKQMLESES